MHVLLALCGPRGAASRRVVCSVLPSLLLLLYSYRQHQKHERRKPEATPTSVSAVDCPCASAAYFSARALPVTHLAVTSASPHSRPRFLFGLWSSAPCGVAAAACLCVVAAAAARRQAFLITRSPRGSRHGAHHSSSLLLQRTCCSDAPRTMRHAAQRCFTLPPHSSGTRLRPRGPRAWWWRRSCVGVLLVLLLPQWRQAPLSNSDSAELA